MRVSRLPRRLLLVGWVNSPHVLDWAKAAVELGYDVYVAGESAENWPPASWPDGVTPMVLARRGPPGLRARLAARQLQRAAAEIQPELVHAHYLSIFGWSTARSGVRPLVGSAWGSDVLAGGAPSRRRARLAIEACDLVLADSNHLAGRVRELARRAVRVEVLNWGVDLRMFRQDEGLRVRTRRKLGLGAAPTVLAMRSLAPLYNPDVLIQAFAAVRQAVPTARLVLKHPDPTIPAGVGNTIARHGVADAVLCVGHVPQGDLPGLYAAGDVAVSIPSSDSSPRSVWEAMACGTPVVVSDLPWAAERLRNGHTAMLVAIEPESVARAILHLLQDAPAARAMAAEGQGLVAREMNRADQISRLGALYESVIGPHMSSVQ
jgi:glycosyltransferase involved in cell wall biosynthesis